MWLDNDSPDGKATAVQIHWPSFRPEGDAVNDIGFYCSNGPALRFRFEEEPTDISFFPAKRSASADASYALLQRRAAEDQHARLQTRFAADTRLVQSHNPGQTASKLCQDPLSAGPSFVSVVERKFCDMQSKTVYPFCADIEEGACWNEEENAVKAKGDETAGRDLPILQFTDTITWK